MENQRLFFVADEDGLNILHHLVKKLLEDDEGDNEDTNEFYCILLPPSYLCSYDDDEVPEFFYEWLPKKQIISTQLLNCLDILSATENLRNSDNTEIPLEENTVTDMSEDNEFVYNCLHEIAFKLH